MDFAEWEASEDQMTTLMPKLSSALASILRDIDDVVEAQYAEIDRLRTALNEIASLPAERTDEASIIARKAVSPSNTVLPGRRQLGAP